MVKPLCPHIGLDINLIERDEKHSSMHASHVAIRTLSVQMQALLFLFRTKENDTYFLLLNSGYLLYHIALD